MAGKVFINYRRGDEPGFAGRLFDRLEQAFQSHQLFMDVDSIAPGRDFIRELEDQVDQCDVLLAIIGQDWVSAKDDQGYRRLDKPDDFVRIEIESGLKLGKRVIPVLINNAQMPSADLLPEPLKPLARRNAVGLTHDRFEELRDPAEYFDEVPSAKSDKEMVEHWKAGGRANW
jgi:TIR domain